MKKLLVLLLVVISALALFAEDVDWLVEDVSGGTVGGTLYVGTLNGPKTLNPYWAQETSSTNITDITLDTMLHADNKGMVTLPGMAKNFWKEETETGVKYYFELRKGLKWSDGVPLTIDDVLFTTKIVFDPNMTANGNGAYLDDQDRLPTYEKVDDYTIVYEYESKFRNGYTMLGGISILPKHVFEAVADDPEKFAQTWTVEQLSQVVGSGPFLISEYKEGVRVVLEKNPYYYAKSKDGVQLPYLDKYVMSIIPDQNTERLKFEAGEIDLIAPTPENFPSLKAQASQKGWKTVVGGPNLGSNFVAFNFNAQDPIKRAWFRDTNFRTAIAYAFDKQSVIDNLYNGLGTAMYGPVSQSSGFYNPAVDELGFRYSLATAKRYLRNSGFTTNSEGKLVDKDGNVVAFTMVTNAGNTVREEICNILVDSLQKLGMEVTYRPINFNTLVNNLSAGEFDSLVLGLTGSVDPGSGWNVWRLDGGLHFWNYSPETLETVDPNDYFVPDYEKRIDEIFRLQAITIDDQKLKELFNEYQMLVAQNQVMVYTVAANYLIVYNDTLVPYNPEPSPAAGVLWNIEAVYKK